MGKTEENMEGRCGSCRGRRQPVAVEDIFVGLNKVRAYEKFAAQLGVAEGEVEAVGRRTRLAPTLDRLMGTPAS